MEKGGIVKNVYKFLTNKEFCISDFKKMDLKQSYFVINPQIVIDKMIKQSEGKLAKRFHSVVCGSGCSKSKDELSNALKEYDDIMKLAESLLDNISVS